MLDLFLATLALATQPFAFIGCVVLGVAARTAFQAIAWAAGWALALQIFATVTSIGLADPATLAVQFGLRAVGAALLTLAIFLLYRALRRNDSGTGRGGSGGVRTQRPNHLRRVK